MTVGAFSTMSDGALRRQSVRNLLRMGHCAPTVMQTMLDASGTEAKWLVLLTAALPGGIGNTRAECGGLTSPLVLMGLRHPRSEERDGLPVVVDTGHDLVQRFTAREGTTRCSAILGDARVPLPCIGVIREAPAMCAHCLAASSCAIAPQSREAYKELYGHWRERGFHCADAVFAELDTGADRDQLTDAITAFMGGTVFTGMTCGAFTAGVMALGLAFGEIEDSRRRVARMIATMARGGDAMADDVNAFNHAVNLGHDLSRWFEDEFGSTSCSALTGCDFATAEGVQAYIEHDGASRCEHIAHLVAERAAEMGVRR